MRLTRTRLTISAAAVTAVAAAGAGAAFAGGGDGGDDGERLATGASAERARTAALRVTHGGTANAVERDGEDGATWEVEVTRPDGRTVDVRLDEDYGLVVVEDDAEEPER